MNKIFTQLLVLVTLTINAQSFELTPDGFKTNTGEDYLVLEYPELSQEQLYKETLIYLNSLYKSPKNVLSLVENEQIAINGLSSAEIRRPYVDLYYNMVIRFKDGKIRVDAPIIEMKHLLNDLSYRRIFIVLDKKGFLSDNHGIWYKGKLALPDVKAHLEKFFSNYIDNIKSAVKAADNW